ncbi:MAG TPA: hypothetical protein VM120_16830 [Bryobacteraceae bacterium]|nr:hypothetical protein [Bryobacteraceae bacterium]
MSEEEFEKLRASCSLNGARSLSDFARGAVMRSVTAGIGTGEVTEASPEPKISTIDRKVHDLERRVVELMSLINNLGQEQRMTETAGGRDQR